MKLKLLDLYMFRKQPFEIVKLGKIKSMCRSCDMTEILLNTKNNKSPGPDEIPIYFYQIYCLNFSPYLLRSRKAVYHSG